LEETVRLFFDYETHSLLDDVLDKVIPTRPVTLSELQIFDTSTQHHVRQIERLREPRVESDCGRAVPMMAILDRPGKYYASGTNVLLLENKPNSKIGA
jgi:hypothetical protein